jgi:hypothetical protein
MKMHTVALNVPAFVISPWLRWAAGLIVAAVLIFVAWRALPLPLRPPKEAWVNPMSKAGGMGNFGKLLPCGHRLSNPIGYVTPDFVCVEGHRFISVGPQFFRVP